MLQLKPHAPMTRLRGLGAYLEKTLAGASTTGRLIAVGCRLVTTPVG